MEEDFRMWGRVEAAPPGDFVAIATAIPESANPAGIQTLTEVHPTRAEALDALRRLVSRLEQAIRAAGGRVIETEVDGL